MFVVCCVFFVVVWCSLLGVCCSLRVVRRVLLGACVLFVVGCKCSWCVVRCSLFVVCCLCVVRCSLFVVACCLLNVGYCSVWVFVGRKSVFAVRCLFDV